MIVGNGNVALDAARVLLMDAAELAGTDIAQHALDALSNSSIREVVILGRRSARYGGAYSVGEFAALEHLPGIDVVVDTNDLADLPDDDVETTLKLEIARRYAQREANPGNKRIVFRFDTTPVEITGTDRAEGGIRVGLAGGMTEVLDTPVDPAFDRLSRNTKSRIAIR